MKHFKRLIHLIIFLWKAGKEVWRGYHHGKA